MNNKGITLVELIISFALLMVIVIGMMSIIMNVRKNYNEKQFFKEMQTYKTTMIQTIEKDLIKKGFVSVSSCSDINETEECKVFNFKDNSKTELRINLEQLIITYGDATDSSKKIIYEIPNKDEIEFLDSRVFDNVSTEHRVTISVTGNYLMIDVPYFEIDNYDNNLGFKIIHPISL